MRYRSSTAAPFQEIVFWTLLLLVTLLPILALGVRIEHATPVITGIPTLDGTAFSDAYFNAKYRVLITATILMMGLFLYRTATSRTSLEPHPIHPPLLLFGGAVVISQIVAVYPTISIQGFYDLRDGTITYLCYAAVLLVASHYVYRPDRYRHFLYALIPYSVVNLLLGLFYFYGVDLAHKPFFKPFIAAPSIKTIPPSVNFTTTLGNPNYSSGFSSMVTLIFLTTALLSKDSRERWTMLGLSMISFTILTSALSSSGFATLILLSPVLIFLAWRFRVPKQTATVALVALVGFALIMSILNARNPGVWNESIGGFANMVKSALGSEAPGATPAPAPVTAPSQPVTSTDTTPELPQVSTEAGFSFGTGRSFIWDRTMKLVLQRPFFGWGLDSISYGFPQMDPEKTANIASMSVIVTKPHSHYFGMAYGIGLVGLLGFVATALVAFWLFVRYVFSHREVNPALVGLTMGWLAYLVQALVNDSNIGYTVVFWVLMGLTTAAYWRESRAAAPEVAAAGAQAAAQAAPTREEASPSSPSKKKRKGR